MSQNTAIRTTGRSWDFLEPAIDPSFARTIHGTIVPAGAGTTVVYPMGQVLRKKDDSDLWAKQGTAGYTGPPRLVKYPFIIDENGDWQYGATWYSEGNEVFEGSMDLYYQGKFKCEDLVGLVGAGGVDEVQTETVTATGGTRTLTVVNPVTGVSRTTAAIAFDANAATIQAALELLDNVGAGDIVVSGAGPYVYTFAAAYADQDVLPIVVGTAGLTGGSSSMAQTTAGVSNILEIGRIIQGTPSRGILQLGEAGTIAG
jgi:hypothetical protein